MANKRGLLLVELYVGWIIREGTHLANGGRTSAEKGGPGVGRHSQPDAVLVPDGLEPRDQASAGDFAHRRGTQRWVEPKADGPVGADRGEEGNADSLLSCTITASSFGWHLGRPQGRRRRRSPSSRLLCRSLRTFENSWTVTPNSFGWRCCCCSRFFILRCWNTVP